MILNEDTRVKIPALIHFNRIKYEVYSLEDMNENIDIDTNIILNKFKESLSVINNRTIDNDEFSQVINKIKSLINKNDLGREFYNFLINGDEKIRLIDFENIDNNDFFVVSELPFYEKRGLSSSFRPDITIFINGMPLAFLEVKKPNNSGGIKEEFNRIINERFKNSNFRKFFHLIQIMSFSNNMELDIDPKNAGSFYSTPNGTKTTFSLFREEKDKYHEKYNYIEPSEEKKNEILNKNNKKIEMVSGEEFETNISYDTPCNKFITSIFDKERFLFLLKYGILYVDNKELEKHIMRYPQFFASRNLREYIDDGNKAGIIWHTQGSGKTALTAFSKKILNDYFSKKHIATSFYFIVDRLDLLMQSANEFQARGLKVATCKTREEFTNHLNKQIDDFDICVANVQKFEDDIPIAENIYGTNVQRIFFIDEAHRSYKDNGAYLTKLKACDKNAIYIALTGTPLIGEKERTSLKFGNYIHTYFYDKSIADGYTLQIKKEKINTMAASVLYENPEIELDRNTIDANSVFCSEKYINSICEYIKKDFKNFRQICEDKTLGGMIVCRSNYQAELIHNWFVKDSGLTTGLVITKDDGVQKELNRKNQNDFRDPKSNIDMLVVNQMLTTGYDVKRLKKMYLLRGPKEHTLLQTISRVNRPYISGTKKYEYGYVVDFADIEKEYEDTIDNYIKELESLYDNEITLKGILIGKEEIDKKYKSYNDQIIAFGGISNIEKFEQKLNKCDIEKVKQIKEVLEGIILCKNEFRLSGADEEAAAIDLERVRLAIKSTKNVIHTKKLAQNPISLIGILENEEIIDIAYNFIKSNIKILDMKKKELIDDEDKIRKETISEIFEKIKENQDDIKIVELNILLKVLLNKLDIKTEEEIDNELREILNKAREIDKENKRILKEFNGSSVFVKTYCESIDRYKDIEPSIKKEILEQFYKIINEYIIEKDWDNKEILKMGKESFISEIKEGTIKKLHKSGVRTHIKNICDDLLANLYINIRKFEE